MNATEAATKVIMDVDVGMLPLRFRVPSRP